MSPTLLEIDLQGARQVRAAMPDAQLVFLAPPSWDELERRLSAAAPSQPTRSRPAWPRPASSWPRPSEFDAVVVNDDVARAAAELVATDRGRGRLSARESAVLRGVTW